MMDLTTKSLPNIVKVGGRDFSIYTDFRKWMRFEIEVSRLEPGRHIDVSYLFKNEHPIKCDLRDLFVFSRPKCELPRSMKSNHKIPFDYAIDAEYIYAAFMSQYSIDLLEIQELHWHKFLALFKGLKEDEMICKIMSYRCYEITSSKKDVYAGLQRAWEIEIITEEDQAERNKFSSYFD